MQLINKRILLTGATGGLGEQLALKLAQKGALLVLVGRNQTKLDALKSSVQALGATAYTIKADLSEPQIANTIVNEAKAYLGNIDVLMNNAGVLDFIELQNQADERIAEIVQTNVTALIQLTRALLPDFQRANDGHFVFIGSIFGSLGFPHFATYCASKFAVHGFSQALRRELVNTHIGVTYVAPRGIKTAMNDDNTVAMWAKSGNAMDSAERVATIIVQALEKEKQEVFIGQPQSFFAWLNGVSPKAVNIGLKKQTALAAPFVKRNGL
ncbi:MAG: SDR family oxidoreductase [Pseudomonadota bacterium]